MMCTWKRVHCHVGSLEKQGSLIADAPKVHCHVGSLETANNRIIYYANVHCHVGSLEILIFLECQVL